ncbi:Hypothetical predicted protein, partial [Xyrichtys novacula]
AYTSCMQGGKGTSVISYFCTAFRYNHPPYMMKTHVSNNTPQPSKTNTLQLAAENTRNRDEMRQNGGTHVDTDVSCLFKKKHEKLYIVSYL